MEEQLDYGEEDINASQVRNKTPNRLSVPLDPTIGHMGFQPEQVQLAGPVWALFCAHWCWGFCFCT